MNTAGTTTTATQGPS